MMNCIIFKHKHNSNCETTNVLHCIFVLGLCVDKCECAIICVWCDWDPLELV